MQRPVVQTFEETPTCCRIRLEKAGLVNAALRCGVKPFSTLTALLCKAVRAYLDKDEVLYSYSTDARDAGCAERPLQLRGILPAQAAADGRCPAGRSGRGRGR